MMRVKNLPWQTTLDGDVVSSAVPRPAVDPSEGAVEDSGEGEDSGESKGLNEEGEEEEPTHDEVDSQASMEVDEAVVSRPVRPDEGVPMPGGGSPARVSAPPPPPDEEMPDEELQELSEVLGDEAEAAGVQVTVAANAPPLSMTPLPVSLRPHPATQPAEEQRKMSPQTHAKFAGSPLLMALAGELPGVPPPRGGQIRFEVVGEQPDTGGAASSGAPAAPVQVEVTEVDRYMDVPVLVRTVQGGRRYVQRAPRADVAIAAQLETKSHGKFSYWTALVVTDGTLLEALAGCSEFERRSVLDRAGRALSCLVASTGGHGYHTNHANHIVFAGSLAW
jgi:hypothetical protein